MTFRVTMREIVDVVRNLTNLPESDMTANPDGYWTNAQVQSVSDRYRVNLREVQLIPHPLYNTGGTVEYKEYQVPATYLESTDGGTARFVVTNGLGAINAGTNWSADYINGLVTFTTDQAGSARYLTGYSYDVYAAAADIWTQKAAQAAAMVDFSTDNHSIKRSHIVKSCQDMASYYASLATMGPAASTSANIERGDLNYS